MTTPKAKPKYGTATSRWAGIGPYYGMFPNELADQVVAEHTQLGDTVIDPFAGRGSAVFSAATVGRQAIGIDVNPLAYVYANAKLKPSNQEAVIRRLEQVAEAASNFRGEAAALPEFFHHCYSRAVMDFLTAARATLNWRRKDADRVLMALILVSLHGKRNSTLSNQMRQSAAMAPDYCVRWWREKNLEPPDVDPVIFLTKRITWRYTHGAPHSDKATVYLGDSRRGLPRLAREVQDNKWGRASLLITSPPYHNVTNYYYDQWLRLWLLGDTERPNAAAGRQYGGKFSNEQQHRQLLEQVFAKCRPLLTDDAVIYVRTDRRQSTYQNTVAALNINFPDKRMEEIRRPLPPERRNKAYSRGGAPKEDNCEIDLVLKPR